MARVIRGHRYLLLGRYYVSVDDVHPAVIMAFIREAAAEHPNQH